MTNLQRQTVSIFFFFIPCFCFAQTDEIEKKWFEVYALESIGLTKSALQKVDSILQMAESIGDDQETLKATLYRSKFWLQLEENAQLKVVASLKERVENSSFPFSNFYAFINAKSLFDYYGRFDYRISSIDEEPIDTADFKFWNKNQFQKELDYLYTSALDGLRGSDNSLDFSNFITLFRPSGREELASGSVHDYFLREALKFYLKDFQKSYLNNLKWLTNQEDIWNSENFLSLSIDDNDEKPLLSRGLKLIQEILLKHKSEGDNIAYLNWEVYRLKWLKSKRVISTQSYLLILDKLSGIGNSHEQALVEMAKADALNELGNRFSYRGDTTHRWAKKEAYEVCKEIIKATPKTFEARQAYALMLTIELSTLDIRQEEFVAADQFSRILVEFKNQKEVNFVVYKGNREQTQLLKSYSGDDLLEKINELRTVRKWTSTLPSTSDYQKHATEILIEPLTSGAYLLVAYDPDQKNVLQRGAFQVTNHTLIELPSKVGNEYLISDRETGKPIVGAMVKLEASRNDSNASFNISLKSNSNGRIYYNARTRFYNVKATVSVNGDTTVFENLRFSTGNKYTDKADELIVKADVFTDRAIYRPGQMLYYKGILGKNKAGKKGIVASEEVIVTIYDANFDEIYEKTFLTNEYGSFSDSLRIPKSVLPGSFEIEVVEGDSDSKLYDEEMDDFYGTSHSFRVENYKRPKFEVQGLPIKKAYVLGDSVVYEGKAISLAGSDISNASVKYTVKRTGYNKRRTTDYYNSRVNDRKVIHEGITETNNEGVFQVKFLAEGKAENERDQLPVFDYQLSVDVTDLNGETRSMQQNLKVGYHKANAYIATLSELTYGSPLKLLLTEKNLNGQTLKIGGKLSIYKLEPTNSPMKDRIWSAPDLPTITKEKFEELFPLEPFENAKKQTIGELIFEQKVSKEMDTLRIASAKNWEAGEYRIEFELNDIIRHKTTQKVTIVNDKEVKTEPTFIELNIDKEVYKPGENVGLTMRTSLEKIFLTMILDRGDRGAKEYLFSLSNSTQVLNLPISEKDLGGFNITYLAQGKGYAESGQIAVNVPYPKSTLELETTSFRNKLEPGEKEVWSFKLKGSKKDKLEAELLASMYDTSLDQFAEHWWHYDPFFYNSSSYSKRIYVGNNFSDYHLSSGRYAYAVTSLPAKSNYVLNWFGYDFINPKRAQDKYFDDFLNPYVSRVRWERHDDIEKGFIKGIIRDHFGRVLTNAKVKLVNSEVVTLTNTKGEFSLQVKPQNTIIISYPKYSTVEVKTHFDNYFDVQLMPQGTKLDDIVVTGYRASTPTKKLTFTVSSVEERVLKQVSATDAGTFLAGKVRGIRVTSASNFGPGNARSIQIRGASSLSGKNAPLIVVDGVLLESNFSDIDFSEVAEYEVLKGTSAATLYGSRAANGVIMLTTKEGKKAQEALLSSIQTRTNFNETAFFFPHLRTNKKGEVSFSFTAPESLTKWKLQLLAHTKSLSSALLVNTIQTQKQLMVIPNLPRFVRETDSLLISVKVASLSNLQMTGVARLEFLNPEDGSPLEILVAGEKKDKRFNLSEKGNESLEWKITIPKGISGIKYKILASANGFTDGEENYLPVLSNRILVTESQPMWISPEEEKTYNLKALAKNSDTKTDHSLTFEFTSNPIWNALQSLPYLIEFPYECSEQTFSRFFANAVGNHLTKESSKLRSLISSWSADESPGPLFHNDALRSIALKETPWLFDAKNEKERLQNLARLLATDSIQQQLDAAINKLSQLQLDNGGFPWFGGDIANRTITTHIVAGFGQLKHIGINLDREKTEDLIDEAFDYLDNQLVKDYKMFKEGVNQYSKSSQIHYLYARSFYDSLYTDNSLQEAITHFSKQFERTWESQSLQTKGMLALYFQREGDINLAKDIMRSLEENSTLSQERGMYWLENESSFNWYQMPIETHALLMEAFKEILPDEKRYQELSKWLLQHKRVNSWSNTKATTSAIYALLRNDKLGSLKENKLSIQVGNEVIISSGKNENNLFISKTCRPEEIRPEMSNVSIKNESENAAWGIINYKYFEELESIESSGGSLNLVKKIFKLNGSKKGEPLVNATTLQVGDRVKVRLLLSTDRDMEFIHLKDLRAAGFEPLEVISEHKNFGGAHAYQSIDDTSIHFFFDKLRKGKYVLEYELIVNNAGSFSTGIATVESMYATEFNSRSNSQVIKTIKK